MQAMWDQFAHLGELEPHAIDSSDQTREETLSAVLDGIARDKRLADEAAAAARAEQDAAEARRVQDAERAEADSLIDDIVDETPETPDPSGETGER